jgi:hypothetical protein
MDVRLRSFPAGSAGVVSGWATTDEEVLMWCGLIIWVIHDLHRQLCAQPADGAVGWGAGGGGKPGRQR